MADMNGRHVYLSENLPKCSDKGVLLCAAKLLELPSQVDTCLLFDPEDFTWRSDASYEHTIDYIGAPQ
eukprot:3386798-Karenia_brevis.AAC.1